MLRLRLSELLASPGQLASFRQILSRGGVAALPTETYYALAAEPTNERGVSRIFEIKGRDEGTPLLALFSSRSQLEALGVSAQPDVLDRLFRIWPAPLTAVLPLQAPIAASRGGRAIRSRCATFSASPCMRRRPITRRFRGRAD